MTEGNEAHVHHLVVTLCTGLNDSHVGNGADCEDNTIAFQVQQCRGGIALAAWAVGGEVSYLLFCNSLRTVQGVVLTVEYYFLFFYYYCVSALVCVRSQCTTGTKIRQWQLVSQNIFLDL